MKRVTKGVIAAKLQQKHFVGRTSEVLVWRGRSSKKLLISMKRGKFGEKMLEGQ